MIFILSRRFYGGIFFEKAENQGNKGMREAL